MGIGLTERHRCDPSLLPFLSFSSSLSMHYLTIPLLPIDFTHHHSIPLASSQGFRRCTVYSVPCTRYRLQCLGIRPPISPPHFACRYLAQVVRVAWPLAHAAEYGALPVHEGERRVELGSGSRVHDQHIVEESDGVQSVRDAQHRHSLELVAHCVLRCGESAYVRVGTSVRSGEFTRST